MAYDDGESGTEADYLESQASFDDEEAQDDSWFDSWYEMNMD